MATTLDWLRGLHDDQLVALLSRRPDLAVPAPPDLQTLSRRLNTAPSIWRALESVDRFTVEVLTALVLLQANSREVSADEVVAFVGVSVTPTQVEAALSMLRELALVRGETSLVIPYPVVDALGPHPAGLGAPTGLDPETLATRLSNASERGRSILEVLSAGPPIGAVAPTGPIAPVVRQLVADGLLIRKDAGLVELPREVGLLLRGNQPLGPVHPEPEVPPPAHPGRKTVDGTGAGQALQTLRQLARLLDIITGASIPVLKSGGLGVRETRKLARDLDVDDGTLSLWMEVLAAANLIATTDPSGPRGIRVWSATLNADEWIARGDEAAWATIAGHWLDLRRDPARAGQADAAGKALTVLSPELTWLRGPSDRRWVLQALAELGAGYGRSVADLVAVFSWRWPLRGADRRERLITQVLQQATTLGVVAFDSLTSAGRALLEGREDVPQVLAASLPDPVRTVLVQADLTVVAPGRLIPELAEQLAVAAEVESAGSATVYRVTPASLRRALDMGMTSGELHRLFNDHSVTPIPQSLTYLIDDMGRRHGQLRAGIAQSYVRCDDPVLIDQAVAHAAGAGILLRRLAPTVAISQTETEELLTELRRAGLVPAAEDEFGSIITLAPAPRRIRPGLVIHQRWREPPTPSAEQLAALVERMRSAEPAVLFHAQTPTDALAHIREAAADRVPVWIEYVNTEGSSTRRLIEPVAISGGTVSAYDRMSNQLRTFALHRITGILPYAKDAD